MVYVLKTAENHRNTQIEQDPMCFFFWKIALESPTCYINVFRKYGSDQSIINFEREIVDTCFHAYCVKVWFYRYRWVFLLYGKDHKKVEMWKCLSFALSLVPLEVERVLEYIGCGWTIRVGLVCFKLWVWPASYGLGCWCAYVYRMYRLRINIVWPVSKVLKKAFEGLFYQVEYFQLVLNVGCGLLANGEICCI